MSPDDFIKVTELMIRAGGRFSLSARDVSKATGVGYWKTKAILNLQASRGVLIKEGTWFYRRYIIWFTWTYKAVF